MEDGLHHARIPEIGVNKQMIEFPLYAYTSTIFMPVYLVSSCRCQRTHHNIRQNTNKKHSWESSFYIEAHLNCRFCTCCSLLNYVLLVFVWALSSSSLPFPLRYIWLCFYTPFHIGYKTCFNLQTNDILRTVYRPWL